jgi:hypothetical protein
VLLLDGLRVLVDARGNAGAAELFIWGTTRRWIVC